MKTVTFARDLRPFRANETGVVPDDVAATLVAAGDAHSPMSFPPADLQFDPREHGQQTLKAPKPARGFMTRRTRNG